MSPDSPRWRRYRDCPACGAQTGAPCVSLVRKDRAPIETAHPARTTRLFETAPGGALRPLTRAARLVVAVMEKTDTTADDIARGLGCTVSYVMQMIREKTRPLSLDQTDRLLRLMSYKLEYRASPLEDTDGDNPGKPGPVLEGREGSAVRAAGRP